MQFRVYFTAKLSTTVDVDSPKDAEPEARHIIVLKAEQTNISVEKLIAVDAIPLEGGEYHEIRS